MRHMLQIPQRHFPKERLSQRKTQTSLQVRAKRTPATGARHRHRGICKSSLLKWKHWPSTEGGTHGAQPQKLMRFFFDLFYEVFPKGKYRFFQNENVFI